MTALNESWFDHEKLEVYREAVAFIAWLSALLEGSVRLGEVKDQLDRASTSVALNIAEGAGEYAPKDKAKFYRFAKRSAAECAAVIEIAAKLDPALKCDEDAKQLAGVICDMVGDHDARVSFLEGSGETETAARALS